jgi:NAD(P)-dependent dehydrogenase (short-subunit alcohol dehydrogenase family)
MQLVCKNMKKRYKGSIINITSLNSEQAFPENAAYVSSKGALKQLTKSAALDLGKYNIRVNNVGPGYMRTAMTMKSWEDPVKNKQRKEKTALNRWGTPSDLIGACVFLASNASSYVTGQDLYVDGGWLIKGL